MTKQFLYHSVNYGELTYGRVIMSEINEEFKTTRMGGYDKEDVQAKFTALKEEHNAELSKLMIAGEEKDRKILKLQDRIEELNTEIDDLKANIKGKYQSYIDNYEQIGQIVYDSKIRSEQIIKNAEEERVRIIEDAKSEAVAESEKKMIELDEKIEAKKRKYAAIQAEIDNIMLLTDDVKKNFMNSFRSVDRLAASRPEELPVELKAEAAPAQNTREENLKTPEEAAEILDSADDEEDFDVADTHEYDASFRSFLNELAQEDDIRR